MSPTQPVTPEELTVGGPQRAELLVVNKKKSKFEEQSEIKQPVQASDGDGDARDKHGELVCVHFLLPYSRGWFKR